MIDDELKKLKKIYFEKAKSVVEHGVAFSFGTDFWDYCKRIYFEKMGIPLCSSCSSAKIEAVKLFYNEAKKINE